MRKATNGICRKAGWWAPLAAIVILAAGCNAEPQLRPLALPSTAPSPAPFGGALNYVFLAAPAAPPSSSTNALVGRYQLEIDAGARSGAQCELIPGNATRRQYTADIDDLGGRYSVKLYDATFLSDSSRVGYGCRDPRLPSSGDAACHQFLMTGDADALTVVAQSADEWRGTEIWEGLSDGFVLSITGRAFGAMRDGRINASGAGALWYGNGLPASIYYGCQVDALRFTLTRR